MTVLSGDVTNWGIQLIIDVHLKYFMTKTLIEYE